MIKIFNEDCLVTMKEHLVDNSIDLVITSPPYNNSRTSHTEYSMRTANCRYSEYDDNKTNEEYYEWTVNIFNGYDKIIKPNGVVLYNISYGSENPNVMFETIYNIISKTDWMVADLICWKKKSALPNNVSSNKLTRICEYVYVFCRKSEYDTFISNKQIKSYSDVGQPFYTVLYNYIEASNNDGTNDLNKATFSTELVLKLIDMYKPKDCDNFVIYDSFMGTGTTANACSLKNIDCYGSELSKAQCDYAEKRLLIKDNEVVDNEDRISIFDLL